MTLFDREAFAVAMSRPSRAEDAYNSDDGGRRFVSIVGPPAEGALSLGSTLESTFGISVEAAEQRYTSRPQSPTEEELAMRQAVVASPLLLPLGVGGGEAAGAFCFLAAAEMPGLRFSEREESPSGESSNDPAITQALRLADTALLVFSLSNPQCQGQAPPATLFRPLVAAALGVGVRPLLVLNGLDELLNQKKCDAADNDGDADETTTVVATDAARRCHQWVAAFRSACELVSPALTLRWHLGDPMHRTVYFASTREGWGFSLGDVASAARMSPKLARGLWNEVGPAAFARCALLPLVRIRTAMQQGAARSHANVLPIFAAFPESPMRGALQGTLDRLARQHVSGGRAARTVRAGLFGNIAETLSAFVVARAPVAEKAQALRCSLVLPLPGAAGALAPSDIGSAGVVVTTATTAAAAAAKTPQDGDADPPPSSAVLVSLDKARFCDPTAAPITVAHVIACGSDGRSGSLLAVRVWAGVVVRTRVSLQTFATLVPPAAGRDREAAAAANEHGGGGNGKRTDGLTIRHIHVATPLASVRVDAAEAGAVAYVHLLEGADSRFFVGGTLLQQQLAPTAGTAATGSGAAPSVIDRRWALQLRVLGTCEERAHAYATQLCAHVRQNILPHDVLRYHVGCFV